MFRLWTKDGTESRRVAPIGPGGGDFVGSATYRFADLPASAKVGTNTWRLFLEAVAPAAPDVQPGIAAAIDATGARPVADQGIDGVQVAPSKVSLDINGDGVIGGFDRLDQYIPGYGFGGAAPKLSTGTTFNDAKYVGQKMNWVVDGLGVGVMDVVFTLLDDVTAKPGFAENASDPKVEGAGKADDYSFDELSDLRSEMVAPANGKALAAFWAKDYGGRATLKVEAKMGQRLILIQQVRIPLDSDNDGIADVWERRQVEDWNTQYGKQEQKGPKFFAAGDDTEEKDPDGLGRGLPAHKTSGDSLTVAQEYRGFILDGGGYDGSGQNGHAGGHKRLSASQKELLVETDRMTGLADFIPTAVPGVMNRSAAGFSNSTNGAGLRMYWVLDDAQAGPNQDFPNAQADITWAAGTRSDVLKEFVHLMFVTKDPTDLGILGRSSGNSGSYVYVQSTKQTADRIAQNFLEGLSSVATHELTHLLLDVQPAANEHVPDGNQNGILNEDADKAYLMYAPGNPLNFRSLLFDNVTRGNLDLTSKQSVERV